MTLRFADLLVKDIPASEFARQPAGVKMNSPAFCFGHLSLYPERAFELIGRPDLAKPDAKWVELFTAGKECFDDPSGSVYPPMQEILDRFRSRHRALMDTLPGVSDEVLMRTNPNERMREWLPTTGSMIGFIVSGHAMSHLGQVSAWRRMKGLGSAM
jgi:hypothetical protein